MKTSTTSSLFEHLQSLGITKNDNVVVHSKLSSFGRFLDHPAAVSTFAALSSIVGLKGTIVVPTYVLDGSNMYDPKTTKPSGVGPLGEYVMNLGVSLRTNSPVHSHAIVGPLASHFENTSAAHSLGKGSDFEILEKLNFKLLLLGCKPSEGCTYLHHLEALANVPYRKWIFSEKSVKFPGREDFQEVAMEYFARDTIDFVEDFDKILKLEDIQEFIIAHEAPYGMSYSISLPDLHAVISEKLDDNPYFLVGTTP